MGHWKGLEVLSELVFFAHLGIYSFVPKPKPQLSIDCAGGCLSGEWVNGVLERSVIETLASGGKVIIISSSIVFSVLLIPGGRTAQGRSLAWD